MRLPVSPPKPLAHPLPGRSARPLGYQGPRPVSQVPRNPDALSTDWHPTGRVEMRRRWYGARRLAREEARRAFRPVVTGYTPANWCWITRWRWAR